MQLPNEIADDVCRKYYEMGYEQGKVDFATMVMNGFIEIGLSKMNCVVINCLQGEEKKTNSERMGA